MATVKQEDNIESSDSDTWLSYWANPQKNIKAEEANVKHECKKEILEDGLDMAAKLDSSRRSEENIVKDLANGESMNPSKNERSQRNLIGASRRSKTNKKGRKGVEDSIAKIPKERNTKIPKTSAYNDTKRAFEESLENANVTDKVANLCQFQCPSCNETFSSKKDFSRHALSSKHIILSRGKKSKANDYMIKTVAHKCKLCDKKVLCDKSAISNHVQYNHNMTLKKYFESMKVEYIFSYKRVKLSEEKLFHIASTLPGKRKISDITGNFCEFKCTKCDYISQRWLGMKLHKSEKQHGLGLGPLQHAIQVTLFRCQVCGDILFCDKYILKIHLQKHKMTIAHYNKSYNQVSFYNVKTNYLQKLNHAIRHIPTLQPGHECFLKPNLLLASQTTGDVGNITLFKCQDCKTQLSSYDIFRTHYKRKHNAKPKSKIVPQMSYMFQKCAL